MVEKNGDQSRLSKSPGQPHPVDIHVGKRLALARKLKGLSQSQLGDALGVTFQQVQKYERGTNRVSASSMFAVMNFLNLPSSYFFEGLDYEFIGEPVPQAAPLSAEVLLFLSSKQGLHLVEQLARAPKRVQNAFAAILDIESKEND
ncbi:helix-turn-helix domain-containing protein [Rhizobium sp. S163]|uniref:helix-turn-helix domain-containing protein n=1 Tax=Rhizobium sp. S163 TaxID=3055039 RepID=UPI000DB9E3A4|nr:helix-turn-helix domain-containing protein [Rhizobium sp. S163]MDM9644873.1 helix-turn-helix domain-containing protein [Rhizobium sp. S163]